MASFILVEVLLSFSPKNRSIRQLCNVLAQLLLIIHNCYYSNTKNNNNKKLSLKVLLGELGYNPAERIVEHYRPLEPDPGNAGGGKNI